LNLGIVPADELPQDETDGPPTDCADYRALETLNRAADEQSEQKTDDPHAASR
jgi:hypothetical protein